MEETQVGGVIASEGLGGRLAAEVGSKQELPGSLDVPGMWKVCSCQKDKGKGRDIRPRRGTG